MRDDTNLVALTSASPAGPLNSEALPSAAVEWWLEWHEHVFVALAGWKDGVPLDPVVDLIEKPNCALGRLAQGNVLRPNAAVPDG